MAHDLKWNHHEWAARDWDPVGVVYPNDTDVCSCGHARAAHRHGHYDPSTRCADCSCNTFRRRRTWTLRRPWRQG